MKYFSVLLMGLAALVTAGCTPSASQLKKAVQENPDIVFAAIEANPKQFIEVVNKAAMTARQQAQEDSEKDEAKKLEEEFKTPKVPEVDASRPIFGNKNAPITIVEYSDFECPFCSRGYQTVREVRKKFGDKVRVVFKHLPLDFHPMAMPAAKYFEAVARQGGDKAEKFHDYIFENQGDLKSGKEEFLKKAAKRAGADMAKLAKDLESEEVKKRIEADMAEAKKFDFSGTPGFLINGISLRGAYPIDYFEKIINRHLEKK